MNNKSWKLQSFVDALVYELDKARTTLSVKGINNPLSYAVKDMDVELQVFPEYDGDNLKFTLAGTGQTASSKLAFKLGSITDRQIRESSKQPLEEDEIDVDDLELDTETKKSLRNIGIHSDKDIERLKENNVNLKSTVNNKINFSELADKIRLAKDKSQRSSSPPKILKTSMSHSQGRPTMQIEGENLLLFNKYEPRAFMNNQEIKINSINQNYVELSLNSADDIEKSANLMLYLDPFTLVKFNVK